MLFDEISRQRDATRTRIAQLKRVHETIVTFKDEVESVVTEGTDHDVRVSVTCHPSGNVADLLIEEDWYRDRPPGELAIAVLEAHAIAKSAAKDSRLRDSGGIADAR